MPHLRSRALIAWIALAGSAWADRVELRTGDVLEGTILEASEDLIVIKTGVGVHTVRRAEVARIARDASAGDRYRRRRAALRLDDAEGHYRLGLWCLGVGLPMEARDEFLQAIRIEPDHVGARRHLGYEGGPGRWYRPHMGERAPEERPGERAPLPGSEPAPEPAPEAEQDPAPAPGDRPGPPEGAVPVSPPRAPGGDGVRLALRERVLGGPARQSNLEARLVNVLRWGARPPFRVRAGRDRAPCRWRIEVRVDARQARVNTFMGLPLTRTCVAEASLRIVDLGTGRIEAEIRGVEAEYTFSDLDACARYALWKAEDALLDRVRRHPFFRVPRGAGKGGGRDGSGR